MGKLAREFLKFCKANNLAKVNDCLSRGVDVNTVFEGERWKDTWSGLMFACELGNSAIVSRLVQVPGLDIDYQDKGYHTKN